jgi:DNA gyrase subunit A
MIGIKGAERNGAVVAAHAVSDGESVISITSDQQMVRSPVAQFTVQGRMAQGVKLVRLSEGAILVSVSVCDGADSDEQRPEETAAENVAAAEEASSSVEPTLGGTSEE